MLDACRKGSGEKFYKDWVERIKKDIPSEKLCVFNVKEGWKPLCEFLDVPVPNEEFPRVNDRETFIMRSSGLYRTIVKRLIVIVVPLVGSLMYGLYQWNNH